MAGTSFVDAAFNWYDRVKLQTFGMYGPLAQTTAVAAAAISHVQASINARNSFELDKLKKKK